MNKLMRECEIFWSYHETELNKRLDSDLPNFKNWKEVNQIPLYSTNDLFTYQYAEENEILINHCNQKEKWLDVVRKGEPFKGHTTESYEDAMGHTFYDIPTSMYVMKGLHHLLTFEGVIWKSILEYDHIIEFGAGIGETARMIFDRGFKGTYSIIDIPAVGRLSKYYLSDYNVSHIDLDDIYFKPKTLFIATWSLSEVPFEYRYKIAEKVAGMDQLILFSKRILGMNNTEFFFYVWPILTKTFIRLSEIAFHPHDGGNVYLIGKGQ